MYLSEFNNEYSYIMSGVYVFRVFKCMHVYLHYVPIFFLPDFLYVSHIPISATASCANLNGTLQDDVSCAVDTADSSTNNTTLIAGLILGSLTLVVFLLLVIGCSVIAIKNKRKEMAVQCTSGM